MVCLTFTVRRSKHKVPWCSPNPTDIPTTVGFFSPWLTCITDDARAFVLNWLQAPDPSRDLESLSGARLDGTGIWLIKSEQFQKWERLPLALWLHGKPGSGKSVLSSLVVEHLGDLCSSHKDWGYAYYYFSNILHRENQSVNGCLTATIKQLIRNKSVRVPENLTALFRESRQPTRKDLSKALSELIKSSTRTYLVLDALDECFERDALLTEVQKIIPTEENGLSVHIILTSRLENDIEASLDRCTDKMSLQTASVDADIQYYTSQVLETDRKIKPWPDDLKSLIKSTLIEKADGTYVSFNITRIMWTSLTFTDSAGLRFRSTICANVIPSAM